MKLLTCVLILAAAARGHAQELMSDNDTQVLRVVLEAMEIPAVVPTGISLGNKTVVISDVTKDCQLPLDEQEQRRVKEFLDRVPEQIARGEKLKLSDLLGRPFSLDDDLVVGPGRIVPKAMVIACRSSSVRRLQRSAIKAPVRVVFEQGEVVEREFRKNHSSRWNRRHPQSVGLIFIATPAYSADGRTAGVYAYHFLQGLGGGGAFYFLEREPNGWQVRWREQLWVE